jgi:hypothetical protein
MFRPCVATTVLLGALVGAACGQAKSANPLSPSIAGPIPGVEISAPQTMEPPANSEVVNNGTPVTLVIRNPTTNGERPLWLELALASDFGFTQVLHQADRITPGGDGQTRYTITDRLSAGAIYYWRVRALDGANTGPWSGASAFTVVDPVVIEPPTPIAPIGAITTLTPVFRVRNGRIEGTTNVIYRIEVGTAPDPASVVAVLEGRADPSGTTSIPVGGTIPAGATFYWRAYATDGTVTSAFSNAVSFQTPSAPVNPPGPGPGPGPTPPPGQRTPNPPPGQRLPLPGYGAGVVEQVARAYPNALRNSCQEHGGTWEFMDRVVDQLRAYDTRWGYNGKRGNAGDPSLDVVAYNYGSQPDQGTTDVYIIDIIVSHCGSNPGPAWIDQTEATRQGGSIGRWISRGRF